jgi:TM2 domain-containing membrane protein YozV
MAPDSSAPQMSVTCPHCQVRLSVPPSEAGTVITCPKCSGKFQVPVPTAFAGGGAYPGASNEVQAFASKKIAAGICGILLGGLGVHKFILGFNNAGMIMLGIWLAGLITGMCLFLPIFASMAVSVIGLVEGIMYLTKSDEDFYQTYAVQKKEWF